MRAVVIVQPCLAVCTPVDILTKKPQSEIFHFPPLVCRVPFPENLHGQVAQW
jgi:hypothetical protein